jgi:hypothetical protein
VKVPSAFASIDDPPGDEAALGKKDRHTGLGHDRGDPQGAPALADDYRVLARLGGRRRAGRP